MTSFQTRLYERLPEIYQIKDGEVGPTGQLEAFVGILDEVFSALRDNVEQLYHDHFIDTCDPWVIPYLADLLGTSHLSGDPWTLRADVARTVFHLRRKGTLGGIESQAFALTGWAAHAVELRERLVWNQHLNHQRPDAGRAPPLALAYHPAQAMRGGTVSLRDPALLSFVDGAFDPFARIVDLKPLTEGVARHNLPNLAIFLWRLAAYTATVTQPVTTVQALAPAGPDEAAFAVRAIIHPLAEPMALFNTHRFRADGEPPNLTTQDTVPGPMPAARLTTDALTGNPEAYVAVDAYALDPPDPPDGSVGLTVHVPLAPFAATNWRFRGANLCAWEEGLHPPLRPFEVAIDPVIGRLAIGVDDQVAEADPLAAALLVSPTYGFSGPTGAHPIPRAAAPDAIGGAAVIHRPVVFADGPTGLADALGGLPAAAGPVVVEIGDSRTYRLDLSAVSDADDSEAGLWTLRLAHTLVIRAAADARPVILLDRPLAFRADDVTGPNAPATVPKIHVHLEGLYLSRSAAFPASAPLIARAALGRLFVDGCTLDPGGARLLDGTPRGDRTPIRAAMGLTNDYGFTDASEEDAFAETPEIDLRRSIAGPLRIDTGYALSLTESIVDAGSGVGDTPAEYAVAAITGDPDQQWGPSLTVAGMTAFGRMRVFRATGQGGIWIHRLEARDDQSGCIRFSYFSGGADRLPPHHGCVFGTTARLAFTAEIFGEPGYAQLSRRSDRRVLEEGPNRDAMGAFGYLLNSHRWKNLNIRLREAMPVGVPALLVPVT
jgi:hypothetical protein